MGFAFRYQTSSGQSLIRLPLSCFHRDIILSAIFVLVRSDWGVVTQARPAACNSQLRAGNCGKVRWLRNNMHVNFVQTKTNLRFRHRRP